MSNEEYIDVSGEGIWKHKVGDKDCKEGWCGMAFPRECQCGGLIHADFGDENYDGDYWLHKRCDICGDNYEEK